MQQVLATPVHPSILAFARTQPPVRPAAEPEAPGLGRRFQRLDRGPRAIEAPVAGPSFLDHLRRLAAG